MNYNDLNDLTKRFLMNEGDVGVQTYVQSVQDILGQLSTRSRADKNRITAAKLALQEIRKHSRRLEERVNTLQEQIKILEESN